MSTYERRARQAASQKAISKDLSTGRDSYADGTLRSDMIAQKSAHVARANKIQGQHSINDNGRPTPMGTNSKGKKEPIASPNLRRESIEIKKANARKKK